MSDIKTYAQTRAPQLKLDKRATKHHKLTKEQVKNMKKLGIDCDTSVHEKQVLKTLRKSPIQKHFSLTEFSKPKFECIIKPL